MKVIPKRKWRYPLALEREYDKRLTGFVEKNIDIIKQFVPEMAELLVLYAVHVDADGTGAMTRLDILMDKIKARLRDAKEFQRVVENIYSRVSTYNLAEWEAITKSVLGAPLRDLPFRKLQQDDEADDTLRELWVDDNISLIRSIDEQTMTRIRDMLKEKILGNVNRRELVKDLTEEIQRIAGLEKNRAALIARDQVGKLNGQLTRFRQENAGIGEYKWSSSHDSRVRPTHRQFDGKIYSWQGSPQAPEGPPGWPIRCRCVALPVIDLDKIVTKPVPGSYMIMTNSVQQRKANDFYAITEMAIEKVKRMEIEGFSEEQNDNLQELHRNVLRTAHRTNKDNEVLLVSNDTFNTVLTVKGTRNSVRYDKNIGIDNLARHSLINSLVFSHNHPSTQGFSLADILMFVFDTSIGVSSVVTNQGQIFLLQKGPSYDYNKARKIWNSVIKQYGLDANSSNAVAQNKAVRELIKYLRKAGVNYEKSNQ